MSKIRWQEMLDARRNPSKQQTRKDNDMKWKAWFKVYGDDKWYTNSKEWDTEDDATNHARDKFRGWTQAQSWMVLQSGVDANEAGKLPLSGGLKGW